uniref:Uncharacterized protein n=1 Tax=Anguilla anguilla TaxID=7936 RepID=A0A0E9TA18_ANGAN
MKFVLGKFNTEFTLGLVLVSVVVTVTS